MSEYNPIVINWPGRAKRAGLSFLIVNLGMPWTLPSNQCSCGIVLNVCCSSSLEGNCHTMPAVRLFSDMVANSAFLKPDFKIVAFFNTFVFVCKSKKARQNLAFPGIFQSERLGSGKTLSELHIRCKSLLKRVYNHVGCTKYWKYFTVSLKLMDVIDKKQMYHNVITWKENVSKECNYITSMFLTSFNVYFVFGYAYFMCIWLKTAMWLFLRQGLAFFYGDRLATLFSGSNLTLCFGLAGRDNTFDWRALYLLFQKDSGLGLGLTFRV